MIHFKILRKYFGTTWNDPISAIFTSMYWNAFLDLTDFRYIYWHVREHHLKLPDLYCVYQHVRKQHVCTSAAMVIDTSEGKVWAEFTCSTPTRCVMFEVVFLDIMMVCIS